MVQTHQVERKVPCTVLETRIENKSYQYVVESDSPIDTCISALDEIREHMEKIRIDILEKEVQENQIQD